MIESFSHFPKEKQSFDALLIISRFSISQKCFVNTISLCVRDENISPENCFDEMFELFRLQF